MTGPRWARWAAGAGLLFVILLVVGFFITSTPSSSASAANISHYYLHHNRQVKVSGLLTYLAVFTGGWFFVYLWRHFRSFAGMSVPAAVSLVGAVIFAVSGALSAGINFSFTDHTKSLNDGALLALNALENDLTYPMTIVGLALFYSAAAIIIVKARAFPRWLGWVSAVMALASLVPPVAFFAFLATPLWVLAVCVLLWRMPPSPVEPMSDDAGTAVPAMRAPADQAITREATAKP
jgi:hypothetical protein